MALFVSGKLFKKAGEGSGGGGDSHNKGWYATLSELQTAYPTAEAGDWAIVGATDTVWIWDTDNSEWVDSDQKGQVTSVNNRTGAVTVSEVPSQTGNAGKFLTTDGTDASWATVNALQNNATGSKSVGVGSATLTQDCATSIGAESYAANEGVAVGYRATTSNYSGAISIGRFSSTSGTSAITIGNYAGASGYYSVAIGTEAKTNANYAIQISSKYGYTNSDANTFKVGNNNGNYEIMSADGTIPTDRFTTTPSADGSYVPIVTISSGVATRSWTTPASAPVVPATMPTLAVADWSSNTQTVNVTGVTASNIVFVSPAPASASDYASAGIICTAQAAGTLTFTCTTVPSNAITVNVVILG